MPTDRLSFRVAPDVKALIDHAAAASGLTATAFAVAALTERAREVVARHQQTTLSAQGFEQFLALLDAPPAPTDALRRAAARHAAALDAPPALDAP